MIAGVMTWFQSLDPTFAGLLALPIAVAIAGLLADLFRHGGDSGSTAR